MKSCRSSKSLTVFRERPVSLAALLIPNSQAKSITRRVKYAFRFSIFAAIAAFSLFVQGVRHRPRVDASVRLILRYLRKSTA